MVTALLTPLVYCELCLGWGGDSHTLLEHIFQPHSIGGLSLALLGYVPYKFVATILSITLPLPVGLFAPVFLTGGLLGRVFGN